MADLTDLARAATETADRAVPPAFESLVARARARHRRRVVTTGAAAALVLAGTAAVLVPRDGTSTTPPVVERPTPSAVASPHTAQQRLAAMSATQLVQQGDLYAVAGTDEQQLGVFQRCVQDYTRCRYAWRLVRDGGVVADGTAPGGSTGPSVTAGRDAFVLQGRAAGVVVAPDGSTRRLEIGDPPLPVTAGDVVLGGKTPQARAVDPATGKEWSVAPPAGTEALTNVHTADDGTVWSLPAWVGPGRVQVSWLRDGTWHSHRIDDPTSDLEVPGILAVGGGHVAALSSFDGATLLPVGVLAVSSDDGATWTELTKHDLPFQVVDSMAATTTGVLFVAEPDGTLWRSTDGSWTSFTKVTGLGRVTVLVPAGTRVLAQTPGDRVLRIAGDGSSQTVVLR